MDVESFRRTRRLVGSEPLILPSFGVHPWEAPRYASDLELLEEPLDDAELIGEIGLDRRFVEDASLYPLQQKVFDFFLDAAERSGRLVNLHTTGAEAEVLESLRDRGLPAVLVHWYSGPLDLVEDFLGLGAYFTIGVEVLRSDAVRTLATLLPRDRLLTETDNPGGWEWMTGERGFPELLDRVEETLAGLRGVERAELSARIEVNFRELLGRGGVVLPSL